MKKRSRTNIQNKSGLDWGSSIVCKAKSPSKKKRNTFMKFLSSDNVFWSYLTCILLLYTYFMSRCYLHLSLSVSFKLCIYIFSMFYLSVSGCLSHFLKQVIIIVQLDSRVWNQLLRMFTTCPWLVGSLQWRKSLEIVPSGNKACTGLFLYPLNTSAKPNVFRDFQGVQIGTVA